MTYEDAKREVRAGKKVSRESWPDDYYIEAESQDANVKLRFVDSCGRIYGVVGEDTAASDWVIYA